MKGFLRVLTAVAAVLSGCGPSRPEDPAIGLLEDPSRLIRESAFQDLLRGSPERIDALRPSAGVGMRQGGPAVAILTARGRGDGIPLDLRAVHFASFEWPERFREENVVVEPYVRDELERSFVKAGRTSLRILGRALERDAPDEASALRVAGTMLRIGGRASAEEFARLLDSERDLKGIRVCDVSSAALLYSGKQELPLRLADPALRRAAARAWWARAKELPESDWIRESVEALAARWSPKDPEGLRSTMEMLVGASIEDPAAWRDANREWRPSAPPPRLAELLPALSLDRPRAWDANRRLEEATGVRVFLPPLSRAGDLCAALRLWQAPPDLALRWKRVLEAPLLRLSIAVIGGPPRPEGSRIRWAYESCFHVLEEDSGELRIETQTEESSLYVRAFDLGTRLVVNESSGRGEVWRGRLREFRAGRPAVLFSAPLKSAIVATVEEVESRRNPPSLDVVRSEWRARLRSWADSREALRALGYFQEASDAGLLKDRRAGEALLMIGDPAGLEFQPRLEPCEVELALSRAEDPRLRDYLRSPALRSESPR